MCKMEYSLFNLQGFGKPNFLFSSYISELESKLIPYMKYALWGDPNNAETTRIIYAKKLPCPFNFIYPPKYKKQTLQLLQEVANFSIDDKVEFHHTTDLIFSAKKTINMLAERIGPKLWFLDSDEPNEVDATVYAVLSILSNAQLQSNDIKNHIGSNPNLLKYIDRIRNKYLSDICVKESSPMPDERASILTRVRNVFVNKEEGTVSNTTMKILFATLTLGTMVVFAFSHGIVEFALSDDDVSDVSQLYYGEHDDEHMDDE